MAWLLYTNKRQKPFRVCDCHYDVIKEFSWNLTKGGYIQTTKDGQTIKIHRLILDAPLDYDVDHKNGDPTDNRCSNLRLCTVTQNNANAKKRSDNTSGYKGVYRNGNGWASRVVCNGVKYYLGTYKTALEAAHHYNNKAVELFGEFARLNEVGGY